MESIKTIIDRMLIEEYKKRRQIEFKKSEKHFIQFLYWDEKMSLRKIGKLFDITYEAVRQKMKKYNIKRRRAGWPEESYKREAKFKSLQEYFKYVKKTGEESLFYIRKFMNSSKETARCEICGGKRFLRFHYLKRPVTSTKDIQIICSTCFYANMRKGLNNTIRDVICKKYLNGVSGLKLAKEYKVTFANIYHILRTRGIKTKCQHDYVKDRRKNNVAI